MQLSVHWSRDHLHQPRPKLLIHRSAENLLLQLKKLGEAGCRHVWQSDHVWFSLGLSNQQPLCINLAV